MMATKLNPFPFICKLICISVLIDFLINTAHAHVRTNILYIHLVYTRFNKQFNYKINKWVEYSSNDLNNGILIHRLIVDRRLYRMKF